MYDSREDTLEHIYRVSDLLEEVEENFFDRSVVHDRSKLEDPEKEYFDTYTPMLKQLDYGTDEYKESLEKLQPALKHHYEHNRHHPEHWENGVNDMSLFDVMEMLIDWKASSERHESGDIWKSIEHNRKRFQISDQLYYLLKNTAKEMGW